MPNFFIYPIDKTAVREYNIKVRNFVLKNRIYKYRRILWITFRYY